MESNWDDIFALQKTNEFFGLGKKKELKELVAEYEIVIKELAVLDEIVNLIFTQKNKIKTILTKGKFKNSVIKYITDDSNDNDWFEKKDNKDKLKSYIINQISYSLAYDFHNNKKINDSVSILFAALYNDENIISKLEESDVVQKYAFEKEMKTYVDNSRTVSKAYSIRMSEGESNYYIDIEIIINTNTINLLRKIPL